MTPPTNPHGAHDHKTEALLDHARTGSENAWRIIYERYRVFLILAVRARITNSAPVVFDPEDIVQLAFLAAWDRIKLFTYRGEGSFRRWLRTIVVNKARDELRRLQREKNKRQFPQESNRLDGFADDSQHRPSRTILKKEETEAVVAALSELCEEEQEILTMREFEGKTWSEIGEILDRPESTVRDYHKKAWKHLANLLPRDTETRHG